jgi:hypothetical protein
VKDPILDIRVGAGAARRLREHGWQGSKVSLLLGASGGPKWLILGELDRVLFEDFLLVDRQEPLKALGSSVGSWRHACLAQPDPRAAIARFEDIYVNWEYSERPDAAEVSAASAAMLAHVFGESGAEALIHHPLLHSYIDTARGRGLNSARGKAALALGLGTSALLNSAGRGMLQRAFQRVVFSSAAAPPLPMRGFATAQVPLRSHTVAPALHASGSIPFVLAGERDIDGAPRGHYWDGGIIDYHFDLADFSDEPLILYPHFRGDLTVGWFDKLLPWRRQRAARADNLILISPSAAFLRSLPLGKIPDRSDFTRMTPRERLTYWRECIARSRELAEAFIGQIRKADPLDGVSLLEEGEVRAS